MFTIQNYAARSLIDFVFLQGMNETKLSQANTLESKGPTKIEPIKHTVELVVPFEDESIYELSEWVRARRTVRRVDVELEHGSLQDAIHKFCRENMHFGVACYRQILMATFQEKLRATLEAETRGNNMEQTLNRHGPDIRKWPFTVTTSAIVGSSGATRSQ